jgi:hypothetical protein
MGAPLTRTAGPHHAPRAAFAPTTRESLAQGARNERASSHSGLDAAQIAAYAAIFNAEVSSSTRTTAVIERRKRSTTG